MGAPGLSQHTHAVVIVGAARPAAALTRRPAAALRSFCTAPCRALVLAAPVARVKRTTGYESVAHDRSPTSGSWWGAAERGGDGQIYFVPQGQESIHAVAPSGLSKHAFRLARVPRNWRLLDLKAAGPRRLAATYYEERPGQKSGRAWFAVYDALLGEQLAVYGPASGVPLCYEHSGRQDLFTVLKDARHLLKLSPS